MPVLDGFSTARIIREEMGLNIPIIAISANSGYDFAQTVREAGMNDYLRKPFSPELLFTSILKVLGIEYSGVVEKKPRQTISKSNSAGLCNIGKLKEIFGDDPVQLKLMIGKFLEIAPGYYNDLLNGYGNGDLKTVRRSAHKLKPSIELFACKKMVANIITIHSLSGTEENSEKLLPFINIFRDSYPKFCEQLQEELHQIT